MAAIQNGWDKCLRLLTAYESTCRTAGRCVRVLLLSEQTFSQQQQEQPPHFRQPTGVATARLRDAGPILQQHRQLHHDIPTTDFDVSTLLAPGTSDWNVVPDYPDFFLDDTEDLAWLSAIPFDLPHEDSGGAWW